MIPNQEKTVTRTGNFVAEDSARLSLDADSFEHLAAVLTDLYSDPAGAVVREYPSNALDSHIEAGKHDVPIQVSLPSHFNSYFTVEDFGVGLSKDELFEVYVKYGKSTKRGTNDQTGMLGLGSKSALTYCVNFTIVAVKDGYQTTATVSRDDGMVGRMDIVDHSVTSKENGVKITIPVKDIDDFQRKASNFFTTWAPGTVIIDGTLNKGLEGERITDRCVVVDGSYYDHGVKVIMGSVAYDVKRTDIGFDLYNHWTDSKHFYIFADMGDVNIAPNREALMMTPKTKAFIFSKLEEVKEKYTSHLRNKCENGTHLEAIGAARELSTKFGIGGMRDGEPVPFNKIIYNGYTTVSNLNHRSGQFRINGIMAEQDKVGILKGYHKEKLAPTHKAKIIKYVNDNDINVGCVLIPLDEEIEGLDSPWLAHVPVIKWEDAAKVKIEVNRTAGKQQKAQIYDLFIRYDESYSITNPADDKKYLYASSREDGDRAKKMVQCFFPDAVFVYLPSNRIDKFKREHSDVVYYRDALRTEMEGLTKFFNEKDLMAQENSVYLGVNSSALSMLNDRAGEIVDEEAREYLGFCHLDHSPEFEKWNKYAYILNFPKLKSPKYPKQWLFTKYPLLSRMNITDVDHAIAYINAVSVINYLGDKK